MQNNIKNKIQKLKGCLRTLLPNKLRTSDGFSLIELIVVISIMLVITTSVLFRQSKFSSDILITNMAYEIALSIREAEVYGVSGRLDYGKNFGYGLRFQMNPDGSQPNTYMAFIDNPIAPVYPGQDNTYDYFFNPNASFMPDVIVGDPLRMMQGSIKRFCGQSGTNTWNCVEQGDVNQVLDIVFVKPDPEARISMGDVTVGKDISKNFSSAIIVVESSLGDKCRTIRVYGSGQVSVDTIDTDLPNGGCDVME